MTRFFTWLFSLFWRGFRVGKEVAKSNSEKVVGGILAAVLAIATLFVGINEGLRLMPYHDSVGVLTVCYGETQGVHVGQKFTKQECDEKFRVRLGEFWEGMHKFITVPVSDKTDAALLSFSYNIGLGGFKRSITLKLLNQGKYVEACKAMMGWVKPPKLKSRRMREVKLCLEGL